MPPPRIELPSISDIFALLVFVAIYPSFIQYQLIHYLRNWEAALIDSTMPQLYPTKTPSKKVNFASDGTSDIPRLVEENPTNFLHSRYFHANIKEKSRLSLPPNFKSKEEFAKTAPEKQKPPIMSVSCCNTITELSNEFTE